MLTPPPSLQNPIPKANPRLPLSSFFPPISQPPFKKLSGRIDTAAHLAFQLGRRKLPHLLQSEKSFRESRGRGKENPKELGWQSIHFSFLCKNRGRKSGFLLMTAGKTEGVEVQTNGHKKREKGKKKSAFNPRRPPFPSSGPFFCASLNVVSSFFLTPPFHPRSVE